jgi:hypothetical protein
VFDFGGQSGEDGERACVRHPASGLADLVHQGGQLLFALVEPAADFLGDRQAEQRHHAVGFDLDQALHGAAGWRWVRFSLSTRKREKPLSILKSVKIQAASSATLAATIVRPLGVRLASTDSGLISLVDRNSTWVATISLPGCRPASPDAPHRRR